MKIFEWALKYLENKGRKYAFVDMYGDIRFYRYYVFYVEKNTDDSWKARWFPNLFVHYFPGEPGDEGPDGDQPHFHPWNTLSIILKGGYTATLNSLKDRTSKALGISYMSYKDSHNITKMTAGTWTLFFHGIRKQNWLVDVRTCENVCQSCMTLNEGSCMKTQRVRPMAEDTELAMSAKEAKGWRKAKWINVDENFDTLIAERKKTLRSLKVPTPPNSSAKFLILKEETIKERRAAKLQNESNT